MQLFTTAEAASYLRLKERKIYEMVAEGTVPCTKVTGRWLFPKADLDHWLASSVTRPEGMTRPEPAPIIGGSHDPLLEWALRESGSGLATLAVGSEAGLARFIASETIAAAIHLHTLEDPAADANVAAMTSRSDMQDAVMIAFCRREQGFLVAPAECDHHRVLHVASARHGRDIGVGRRIFQRVQMNCRGDRLGGNEAGKACFAANRERRQTRATLAQGPFQKR